MKTIFLILGAIMLCKTSFAQNNNIDSVFWDNGNVSLLSDLAPVFIILKKGSDLKNVRIKEIKKERGILVYEKEKCLHDVNISNIKKIEAGKHTTHPMFFYADNTPYIKTETVRYDPLLEYKEFKSVLMPVKVMNEPQTVAPVMPVIEKTPPTSFSICDTIVDVFGTITLAKIIEIDDRLISYKKLTNPNGPVYIKANNNAIITKYHNCMSIQLK